jgi:D-3-phosphoglycerate dehydrogenase
MKVVAAEPISKNGLRLLAQQPEWVVVDPAQYAQSPDTHLADADALIVRSAVYVDAALLEKAPKLRVIGRAGVGVDNIDVEAATRRGIVVMNTPGANAVAVAELTIGLMISLARHLSRADASTRAGKWEKKIFQGTELRGKELGILGLGRIGVEVARRAKALGMNISAHDPYVSPALARDLGIKLASLDDLYARADYLSLHLGLTPQTHGIINAESLAKMKKGVRIVNCARGELIDDKALCEALCSGQVAAAALDVFTQEPPKGSPLLELPNVIATPHIGASTAEAQDAVGVQLAEQIREYLSHGVVQNAVNVTSLTEVEFRQLSPYIDLARRMASLLAQLMDAKLNLEEIRVGYEGAVGEWKTSLLRDSAVAGVLQSGSQEVVNIVNAAAVAATRGVSIREDSPSEEERGPINALRLSLKGNGTTLHARGTVIHRRFPRIIELNGIEIESPLEGHLVVFANKDLPGAIGGIGTILGKHSINIARFSLGREANGVHPMPGQAATFETACNAMAIVQTDSPVPHSILEEIRGKVAAVMGAKSIYL